MDDQQRDEFFERLWTGAATLEDWTATVAGGVAQPIADDVITIHTSYLFGNATALRTSEGIVLIDSGSRETAAQTFAVLRRWDEAPVHTIIYTHGHIDHTWGARLYDQEADGKGFARPRVIAHRNVLNRFKRYDTTHDLNSLVMGRQFNQPGYTFPDQHRRPDEVYDETLSLDIGGTKIELMHGRGETDDATFVWLPQKQIVASGDFVIWVFPNAGNPRKVQRYAPDWARALRQMQALTPAVLVPGHGPVVRGAKRVDEMLGSAADVLESLTTQTLALMNTGSSLDDILHKVSAPPELLARPWLKPKYDDPEFVVRNIWHLYAGWFDGNPSHLKPASDAELAAEISTLVGGVDRLARRAGELAASGHTRLAAHLIEFASDAMPQSPQIQSVRAEVYGRCAEAETSLIGKAIFSVYQRDAKERSTVPIRAVTFPRDESAHETEEILAETEGGQQILDWLASFPGYLHAGAAFGDFEVVSFHLRRESPSELVLNLPDSPRPVTVTFTLGDWIDTRIEGFSHQNVIGGLRLRRAGLRDTQLWEQGVGMVPGLIEIELEPCFGANGVIRATLQKVHLQFS
ncbi:MULTISPECIES: alkyl sulfatase dimerization domain-containing protein [unclassified Beijerinckia]|uniref:alkyl sulfatase dimerization domain-containing protein n=1 Tax=unclassified Beijerinckia TaxID=2638183 RepID=UPI00089A3401|nr:MULTISPECIES: alkyl sulfatase dimerization domain-containing protein [unclassified Beijerinckia]MDH7796221.1 alkyl sulfatase BDS1-like metallo-beta-lactamase superfamily hydrolase [Beijerinckia sp. GAS462]SEC35673.1 Metallo-beta-lactamase superfamily protein [Beijerinckia sp. 28-YEA-48]